MPDSGGSGAGCGSARQIQEMWSGGCFPEARFGTMILPQKGRFASKRMVSSLAARNDQNICSALISCDIE